MTHADNLTAVAADAVDQAADPIGNEADRVANMTPEELAAYLAAEPVDAEPSADRIASEAERLKTSWAATPGATTGMSQEAVDAMALAAARERLTRAASPTPSASSPIPPPSTGPGVGYGHQTNGSSAVVSAAEIDAAFAGMASAPRFGPVPSGEYVCKVIGGEFFRSRKKQTPGFKVTFQIVEGEFTGRRVWFDVWLTGPALAARERELKALGITDRSRMVEALPPIIANVRVVQRQSDTGVFYNEIARGGGIEFIGIAAPEAEPADAGPDPFDVDIDDDQAAKPAGDADVQKTNEGEGQ